MAWPPPVLPINRTNAQPQLDTHPADHNAVNLAVNDLVIEAERIRDLVALPALFTWLPFAGGVSGPWITVTVVNAVLQPGGVVDPANDPGPWYWQITVTGRIDSDTPAITGEFGTSIDGAASIKYQVRNDAAGSAPYSFTFLVGSATNKAPVFLMNYTNTGAGNHSIITDPLTTSCHALRIKQG